MTHKIIFYCAFLLHLRSPYALPPWLLHRKTIKLVVTPGHPTSSCTISHHLPTSFPMVEKKRGSREIDLKEQEGVVELTGVISLSLLFHGGDRLAHVKGYARAYAKSHKSEVYDSGGVSYLSCA
jgi:hypothetical protein